MAQNYICTNLHKIWVGEGSLSNKIVQGDERYVAVPQRPPLAGPFLPKPGTTESEPAAQGMGTLYSGTFVILQVHVQVRQVEDLQRRRRGLLT